MKFSTIIALVFFGCTLPAQVAFAQSDTDFHPLLTDKFYLAVGGFLPDKSFKIRVDGTVPEEEIDFDESLRLDDDESTPAGQFRWNFGEKWSFWTQYWTVEESGGAVLEEDLEWEDVVFEEGSFVRGGFDLGVARIFFGRKIVEKGGHQFGVGAGLHWLEISTFLEGEAKSNFGETGFVRESVEAEFPLPNIGAWYDYSWSPKWMAVARVDWLSASVGDYSGGLWNASAGINWAAWRHFGFQLNYNFFRLDGDVDKSDWRGGVEATQHGPFLALTASW